LALEAGLVDHAADVHVLELLQVDYLVQVFIHLPDHQLDVLPPGVEPHHREHPAQVGPVKLLHFAVQQAENPLELLFLGPF
jgi:hypothetical protein